MESLDSPLLWANFILWICITALIVIISWRSFRLAKQRSRKVDESQEKNLRIWGYFFLILAVSHIVELTWRFAVSDVLIVDILERTAHTLFYIALFIRVFNIEKSLIELNWYKRYYFSSIVFLTILINIVVPASFILEISPFQILFLILVALGFSVFPIIYFYVSRKSSGKVRRNALKVSIGAVFLALGYLFNPRTLTAYREIAGISTLIDWLYITAPISIIIGALFIYDSFRKID